MTHRASVLPKPKAEKNKLMKQDTGDPPWGKLDLVLVSVVVVGIIADAQVALMVDINNQLTMHNMLGVLVQGMCFAEGHRKAGLPSGRRGNDDDDDE